MKILSNLNKCKGQVRENVVWIGGEDYGTNLHTDYKSVHNL